MQMSVIKFKTCQGEQAYSYVCCLEIYNLIKIANHPNSLRILCEIKQVDLAKFQ